MESQQETSHQILKALLQELIEREEDFSFYTSICLRLLERCHGHFQDMLAFFEALEPEDLEISNKPAVLRKNPKFLESEWLMAKYSTIFDSCSEALVDPGWNATEDFKQMILIDQNIRLPYRIANAHYGSYFEQDPQRRIVSALQEIVGADYSVEDLIGDLQNYLQMSEGLQDFPALCHELAVRNEDLKFFAHLCVSLLEPITWPVDDLHSFLEEIGLETSVEPVDLPKLCWHEVFRTHENDIFNDREQLMQKYSILAEAFREFDHPDYPQLAAAARIARAQYELFFTQQPQIRILKALYELVSEDCPASKIRSSIQKYPTSHHG